jgi:hypothetical protein
MKIFLKNNPLYEIIFFFITYFYSNIEKFSVIRLYFFEKKNFLSITFILIAITHLHTWTLYNMKKKNIHISSLS